MSLQKLTRRQAAVNKIHYSQRSRDRVAAVMTMDYMSSEETDDEADQEGVQQRSRTVRRRKVRRLSGGSHQLNQLKTDLDTYYWTRIATSLANAQRADVVRPVGLHSNRTVPEQPKWAHSDSERE